ncbi:MAG: hypothetical protein WC843_02235 [Candidatus Gracilibacteria bacterium]|jgi:hypothetical protein
MSSTRLLLKTIAQSKLLSLLKKEQIFELLGKISDYSDAQIENAIKAIKQADIGVPVQNIALDSEQNSTDSEDELKTLYLLSKALKEFDQFETKENISKKENSERKNEEMLANNLLNSLT